MVTNPQDITSTIIEAATNGGGGGTGKAVGTMLTESQALLLLLPIGIIGIIFGLLQIKWLSGLSLD